MIEAAAQRDACPKCGFRARSAVDSCARCGLVFARWAPQQASSLGTLDDVAEALWRKAEETWQDPAAHDAFLKHCSLKGLLGPAGRRYRERMDRDPSDAIAQRMQERVLSMAAMALGIPTRPPAVVTRTRWFWAVIALGVCAGIVAAFLIGRR